MRPDTASLPLLIELTQTRVDAAGRLLADLNAQRQQALAQLETLEKYQADYAQRLLAAAAAPVSTANYHNFRRFISTLETAISQQNKVIAQIDVRLGVGRAQWYGEKRRLNAFEILKARQDRYARYQDQRREQRVGDELSAGMRGRPTGFHALGTP